MPPSLRDWLPADHLAWFVIETVEQLDLSAFYAAYRADGHGRAAYEPSVMVSLVLFAYSTGERSSRGIERHCRQDIAYRVITGNRVPDHATVARFIVRHEQRLGALFGLVLRLCANGGLVASGVVAIDGTKLSASAASDANVDYDRIARGIIGEAIKTDRAEEQKPGVGWDSHDRLSDAQGDDLSVGDLATRVAGPLGQEIISDAINNNEQQVEVGEHRGSSWESAVTESTADFDPPRPVWAVRTDARDGGDNPGHLADDCDGPCARPAGTGKRVSRPGRGRVPVLAKPASAPWCSARGGSRAPSSPRISGLPTDHVRDACQTESGVLGRSRRVPCTQMRQRGPRLGRGRSDGERGRLGRGCGPLALVGRAACGEREAIHASPSQVLSSSRSRLSPRGRPNQIPSATQGCDLGWVPSRRFAAGSELPCLRGVGGVGWSVGFDHAGAFEVAVSALAGP